MIVRDIIEKCRNFSFLYYFRGKNKITIREGGEFEISETTKLQHCRIFIAKGSSLKIGEGG